MPSPLPLSRVAIAAVALAQCPRGLRAAETTPQPSELRANVISIEDNRASGGRGSSCRVMVNFVGDEVADADGVLSGRVTKALDDLDRDLVVPEAVQPERGVRQSLSITERWMTGRPQPIATLALRNPSRRAATIKVIEGVADLFRPTEANEGLVIVPEPLAHRGVAIKNATLEKYGIELTCLTDEKAAELRRVSGVVANPTREDERRRLEAVAAEVARRRALREQGLAATGMQMVPAPATLPPSEAKVTTTEDPAARAHQRVAPTVSFSFQIKDPQHKLVDFRCCDADGNTLGSPRYGLWNGWTTLVFAKAPPADAHLVVYVAAPGAIETHRFKVENIALP